MEPDRNSSYCKSDYFHTQRLIEGAMSLQNPLIILLRSLIVILHALKEFWKHVSLQRWLDVIILSLVGSILCLFFSSYIDGWAVLLNNHLLQWPTWIRSIFLATISCFICFILKGFGGFQNRGFFRYPPIWLSSLLGLMLYYLFYVHRIKTITFETANLYLVISSILIGPIFVIIHSILYDWSAKKKDPTADRKKKTVFIEKQSIYTDSQSLLEWLKNDEPIRSDEEDLFDLAPYAERIVNRLQDKTLNTIGLIGPYGCGKSSILNLVELNLKKLSASTNNNNLFRAEDILICWVEGWGFNDISASEHILTKIIEKLSQHVDTSELLGLPYQYRTLFKDAAKGWLAILLNIVKPSNDPIEGLKKIDQILFHINKRIVVFLEDVDRNQSTDLICNEISSLLNRLKNLDNVSFILAIGNEHQSSELLIKICEYREDVSRMSLYTVCGVLQTFRNYCLQKHPGDIDCLSEKERDERLGTKLEPHRQMMLSSNHRSILDSIAVLISNPRIIKFTLRRIDQIWESLHGEIDFDDLFITNILRFGAPEVFAFVDRHISQLRVLSDNVESKKNIENELHRQFDLLHIEINYDPDSITSLLSFLFNEWEIKRHYNNHSSLQGVSRYTDQSGSNISVDYWERIKREKTEDNIPSDQAVLKSIFIWKNDPESKVIDHMTLPQALYEKIGVAERLEYFGKFLNGTEIRQLAEKLFTIIREDNERHPRKSRPGDYPGFIELWRLSTRNPFASHEEWISEEICKALPVSLSFANDLFYFWCAKDQFEFGTNSASTNIRKATLIRAHELFLGNPNLLVSVLSDAVRIFTIYNFAVFYSSAEFGETGFNPSEWQWLGEVLLKAADINPQIIIPQIVPVIVNRTGDHIQDYSFHFDNERINQLFADKVPKLFQHLAETKLERELAEMDSQEIEYIKFAQNYAKSTSPSTPSSNII